MRVSFLLRRIPSLFVLLCLVLSSLSLFAAVSQANPTGQADNLGVVRINVNGRGDIDQITTSDKTVNPARVGNGVPVRIVRTYSFNERASSDPALVAGKTGRVRIDVSVYNLTGKIEEVNADVNGRAIKQSQLVLTPLSVAASVHLKGVSKTDIVIPPANTAQNNTGVTNGVVGSDQDDDTVVQWAGITGLDSDVARFSLVLNAKNFTVPDFDVLVQPGFGINGDTKTQKDESKLVISTLKTLGDAGRVLDDSGKALGDARKILEQAGSQIGKKTIADLNASNSQVTSSAEQIVSTLNGINSKAAGLFKNTDSHVSSQLVTTTNTVKALLGNPQQPLPKVKIDKVTCTLQSPDQKAPNQSVYTSGDGSVLGVVRGLSARLDALAATSTHCQQMLLNNLDNLLGPEQPDSQTCAPGSGLSCQVWNADQNFKALLETNRQRGQKLVQKLDDGSQNSATLAVDQLKTAVQQLDQAIGAVKEARNGVGVDKKLEDAQTALRGFRHPLNSMAASLDTISDLTGEIGDASEKQDQNLREAKRVICVSAKETITTDPELSAKGYQMNPEAAKKLLALLADSSCPAQDPGPGAAFDGNTRAGGRDSAEYQGRSIRQHVTEIYTHAAPSVNGAELSDGRQALKNLQAAVDAVDSSLQTARNTWTENQKPLDSSLRDLKKSYRQVSKAFKSVESATGTLSNHVNSTASDLEQYVQTVHAGSNRLLDKNQTGFVNGINDVRRGVGTTSGSIFDSFSAQILSESQGLREQSAQVVGNTNQAVEQANTALSNSTSKLLADNTTQLGKVTNEAVVDTKATSQLLAGDIARVLADIGTNTNRGSGLLGAVATSQAHLGLADVKLTGSTTHMTLAQSNQRTAQASSLLEEAALRAGMARLEGPIKFPAATGETSPGWFSFHLNVGKEV